MDNSQVQIIPIILLFIGLFLIIIFGILFGRRFKKLLKWDSPDKVSLFRFAYQCGAKIEILAKHIEKQNKRFKVKLQELERCGKSQVSDQEKLENNQEFPTKKILDMLDKTIDVSNQEFQDSLKAKESEGNNK